MKLSSINSAYSLSLKKPKQAAVKNNSFQNKIIPDKKKKIARGIIFAASVAFLGAALFCLCKPDKTSQMIEEAVSYIKKDSEEIIDRGNKLFAEAKDLLKRRTNDTFDGADIPASVFNPKFSTIDDKYGKRHILSYLKPDNSIVEVAADSSLKINYIANKPPKSDFIESFSFDNETLSSFSRHYTKTGMPDNRSDYFLFQNGKLTSFKKGFKKADNNKIMPEELYLFDKKGACTHHTKTSMAPNGSIGEEQSFRRTIFGNYKDTAFDDIENNHYDYFDDLAMALSDGFLDFIS